MSRSTVLVVPCFNEADRLDGAAFVMAVESDAELGLLFVDDGSRDGTWAALQAIAAQAPPGAVELLRLERNGGKGEAVRRGMLRALERGAALTGYIDADLSVRPGDLAPLRRALAGDPRLLMAFGSRVKVLGSDIRRSALRHYSGRVFATAIDCVLRLGVYDTQCGAKLLRADPRVVDVLARPFLSRWVFDVELIARLAGSIDGPASTVLSEVPLERWHATSGSKLRPRHIAGALRDLLRIYLDRRAGRNPSAAPAGDEHTPAGRP